MLLFRRASADAVVGLVTIAIGIFVGAVALGYPFGTVTRMGPGFFPTALGVLMIIMGLGILIFEARANLAQPISRPAWKSLCFVLSGAAAFAILIDTAGLGPAAAASIFIASCANPQPRLSEMISLAFGGAVFCILVFIYGLQLPLKVISW